MARADQALRGTIRPFWRFLTGLSVWPCARSARTPRSLPNRPGGAVSPYGQMGHGVQRRQRRDGQAAGPAAVRWPAAARPAAGQIEKPPCSASFHSSCRRCRQSGWRTAGACLNCLRALPAARRANHHAGEAGPRALREIIMTSCSSWLPGGGAGVGRAGVCWQGCWVATAGPNEPRGAVCHLMPSWY